MSISYKIDRVPHPIYKEYILATCSKLNGGAFFFNTLEISDEELILILKSKLVPDEHFFNIALWYDDEID